jgi:hypothetical protein
MLRCKDVANAMFEGDYQDLPWWRRWGLKMHVALCIFCHGPHKQLMQMQDGERIFRGREDALHTLSGPSMGADAKLRVAAAIHEAVRANA